MPNHNNMVLVVIAAGKIPTKIHKLLLIIGCLPVMGNRKKLIPIRRV